VLLAAVILGIGVIGGALAGSGGWVDRSTLDPDSPRPDGARALARTLSEHGATVSVPRSFEDATAPGGTLVVGDTGPLSDEQVAELAERAADVVFLQPGARDARVVFDAAPAGFGPAEAVEPDCAVAEAERSGPVAVGALFDRGNATAACYAADGGYGLLLRSDDRRVALVDGESLFTNERISDHGNAALALNLLGRTGDVVWYVPALDDAEAGEPATLGELTPSWVTPAIVLLLVAAITAALWRGRHFGPLVAERLPVTVRAGETTRGRAQLYARSGDAAHAAELVRAATRRRLARRLGLPGVPADVLASAVATRLGRNAQAVTELLAGHPSVTTDADLVRLLAALDDLESAMAASTKGES
jgi:hypothetical protein